MTQETRPNGARAHERACFVKETADVYDSAAMQAYVRQETERPSKAWVQEVVNSTRESEFVKLRTPDVVLLPDMNVHRRHVPRCECSNGKTPMPRPQSAPEGCLRAPTHAWPTARPHRRPTYAPAPPPSSPQRFNWLAIMTNPGLRCIRDLRGEHLPMLEEMHRACVEAIQREYKVGEEDIMVFANYPPSVYRLHFHFCAPFFQPSAYDAFRMHSLSAIMNNLRIREDYYAASAFQIPVHLHSELFRVFVQPKGGTPSPSGSDEETRECVA